MNDQLQRAQNLMTQALRCAGSFLSNDKNLAEAKSHIKNAINKIEKTKQAKKANKEEKVSFWDDITAKTVNQPMANVSQEAYNKTLKQLNFMIDEEKKKLEDLEKIQNQPPINDLFNG